MYEISRNKYRLTNLIIPPSQNWFKTFMKITYFVHLSLHESQVKFLETLKNKLKSQSCNVLYQQFMLYIIIE